MSCNIIGFVLYEHSCVKAGPSPQCPNTSNAATPAFMQYIAHPESKPNSYAKVTQPLVLQGKLEHG